MLNMARKAKKTPRNVRYRVPNVDRTLSLMELLSRNPNGLTKSEIVEGLRFSTNAVYRIALTLMDRGYLVRDDVTRRFRLTGKMLDLGCASRDERCVAELSWEPMRTLRDETGETTFLCVRSGFEGVVIEHLHGIHQVRLFVEKGHRFELHAGAPGKSLLAFLPEDEARTIVARMSFTRFTENTVTDRGEFLRLLQQVRAQGYSEDRAESLRGVHCIAAPLRDDRGQAVASICVTAPADRMPETGFPEVAARVKACGSAISSKLGYHGGEGGKA